MPVLGHFSISFMDRTRKQSVQRLSGAVLTSGNIVAQTAAWASLVVDTEAMSLGTLTRWIIGNETTAASPSAPTANDALRSTKFAVTYHDTTTGDIFTTQIPIANVPGVVLLAGTKLLDLSMAPASTYKTDFEAVVQSEEAHAVVIDQIRVVGRHI